MNYEVQAFSMDCHLRFIYKAGKKDPENNSNELYWDTMRTGCVVRTGE
jgi:hypothetical protein